MLLAGIIDDIGIIYKINKLIEEKKYRKSEDRQNSKSHYDILVLHFEVRNVELNIKFR
jgi:hypothetical protein